MKNIAIYIDLVFCLIVLPLMALIFPIERWVYHFGWYVALSAAWLYISYVVNRVVTVPMLFRGRRQQLLALGIIVASIGVTFLLSKISLYTPSPSRFDFGLVRRIPSLQPYQQALWTSFMLVTAFSFAVGLLTQVNQQRQHRRVVEAERDRAEIELYKAQIKPHFMFNILNSLYGLFLTHSPKALESFEKFISMIRYIHVSSQRDFIPLQDEADYIRRYVEIMGLRLTRMTTVDLDISLRGRAPEVPPMLLVTFVENCFKHGVSTVEESGIEISLTQEGNNIRFFTRNRIFPVKRIGEHMGIANCRKRLGIMYPGRHSLDITDDGEYFTVELSIEADQAVS
ncbi:MAG: histidine kinase [Muribaculaceae bacterium]|nr:histidine kinase [Muribaculaceae bacterium]